MRIHAIVFYHATCHTFIEVLYQCSARCMANELERNGTVSATEVANVSAGYKNLGISGSISWGGWPGGSETDYDVYCSLCGILLWKAISYT